MTKFERKVREAVAVINHPHNVKEKLAAEATLVKLADEAGVSYIVLVEKANTDRQAALAEIA